jgi:hypothetical protein
VTPEELTRVTKAGIHWMAEELQRRGIPSVVTYAIGETSVLAANDGVKQGIAGTPTMLCRRSMH